MADRKRPPVIPEDPPPLEQKPDELNALTAGQLEATSDLRERVKALEAELKHYATKAEVANVKVWWLGGLAAGLFTLFIALIVAVFRLLWVLGAS